MTKTTATKESQVTIRVIWDSQDAQNKGWSFQLYDGTPDMRQSDLVLVSSGPVIGRQSARSPARARVLRSAGVRGNRYVHVIFA